MSDMRIDVLGLGVVTIDHVLYVDTYPVADTKLQISSRKRYLGGLTSIALAAASRFGCRCAYAGTLGNDPLAEEAAAEMAQLGIDLSLRVFRPDGLPIEATIIVAKDPPTRTILFDAKHAHGADLDQPSAQAIQSARVLLVDNFGVDGMIRAARIAREAVIPVVADFESDNQPRFSELLALADHLILSRNFASHLAGTTDPVNIAQKLWTADRKVVVITCGVEGAWAIENATAEPHFQPAYPVSTIDSTGCGDVFHGVYAGALAQNILLPERLRLAAAAAALKAATPGGPAGIPDRQAINAFLAQRGDY